MARNDDNDFDTTRTKRRKNNFRAENNDDIGSVKEAYAFLGKRGHRGKGDASPKRALMLNAEFAVRLARAIKSTEAKFGKGSIRIDSFGRTFAEQQMVYRRNGGNRKYAALPGNSRHEDRQHDGVLGTTACDINMRKYGLSKTQRAALNYLAKIAAPRYGLQRPMSNEDWHFEPTGSRNHQFKRHVASNGMNFRGDGRGNTSERRYASRGDIRIIPAGGYPQEMRGKKNRYSAEKKPDFKRKRRHTHTNSRYVANWNNDGFDRRKSKRTKRNPTAFQSMQMRQAEKHGAPLRFILFPS